MYHSTLCWRVIKKVKEKKKEKKKKKTPVRRINSYVNFAVLQDLGFSKRAPGIGFRT